MILPAICAVCVYIFVKYMFRSPTNKYTSKSKWKSGTQEYKTEVFYNSGLTGEHDYHGSYLNFGYWRDTTDYVTAAKNLVSLVADCCGVTKDSYLLDIACGMGVQSIFMRKKYGCKIDAVDVCDKHIHIAKQKLAREEKSVQDDIKFFNHSATHMPPDENKYSNVICIEGGPHMKTREKFLEEAYRVLKPDGKLCIADIILREKPTTRTKKIIQQLAEIFWCSCAENSYTEDVLIDKMRNIGYTDINIEDISKDVIPGYYLDTCNQQTRKECAKVRGWFVTYCCHIIDYMLYKIFEMKMARYVIVSATKSSHLTI